MAEKFRLEPLGPQHNERDFDAWTSSVEHIRATPGFTQSRWPDPSLTLEQNAGDLRAHEADFVARRGFTYTVLNPDGPDVIGCVYIYPAASTDVDAKVRLWVRASSAPLDSELFRRVRAWLAEAWPWSRVDWCGR